MSPRSKSLSLILSALGLFLFLGLSSLRAQPAVPSIQLDTLREKPKPDPTPEPQPTATPEPETAAPPAARLTLTTMRVVRINHYSQGKPNGTAAIKTPQVIEPAKRSMRELMELGVHYTFSVKAPQGWDLLRIAHGELTEALDDQGNRLNPWPSPAAQVPGQSGASENEASDPVLVTLRSAPPAPGSRQLKKLAAKVDLLLGKRQPVRVMEIRRQIDRSLLEAVAPQDIVLRITAIDETSVSLSALGRIDRIGAITFEDDDGDPIEAYSREIQLQDQDAPLNKQAKDWVFRFEWLPPDLNMRLAVYPQIKPQTASLELTKVPLP